MNFPILEHNMTTDSNHFNTVISSKTTMHSDIPLPVSTAAGKLWYSRCVSCPVNTAVCRHTATGGDNQWGRGLTAPRDRYCRNGAARWEAPPPVPWWGVCRRAVGAGGGRRRRRRKRCHTHQVMGVGWSGRRESDQIRGGVGRTRANIIMFVHKIAKNSVCCTKLIGLYSF